MDWTKTIFQDNELGIKVEMHADRRFVAVDWNGKPYRFEHWKDFQNNWDMRLLPNAVYKQIFDLICNL